MILVSGKLVPPRTSNGMLSVLSPQREARPRPAPPPQSLLVWLWLPDANECQSSERPCLTRL